MKFLLSLDCPNSEPKKRHVGIEWLFYAVAYKYRRNYKYTVLITSSCWGK